MSTTCIVWLIIMFVGGGILGNLLIPREEGMSIRDRIGLTLGVYGIVLAFPISILLWYWIGNTIIGDGYGYLTGTLALASWLFVPQLLGGLYPLVALGGWIIKQSKNDQSD